MTGQTLGTRGLEALNRIPLSGFVNGIAVGPKARFCVVASGQEPRLGRWDRIPRAKNRFGIVRLRRSDDVQSSEEESRDVDIAEGESDSDSASKESDNDDQSGGEFDP